MAAQPQSQSLSIQPSPRILRILGDIEFEAWQCIAELVDNAFDDFLEIQRANIPWPDGFRVSISLPEKGDPKGSVRIEDSGRGMTLEALNNAVRAGWSSNDRFSKLGLFGMGFNIATARLGRVARVLTTRTDDTEWVGVEINLDKIGADYMVPVLRRPKQHASHHGTVIEIEQLEAGRGDWLARNAKKLKDTLGDVYAYLLGKQSFKLYVDEVAVEARKDCVWDASRSVTYGVGNATEVIPAIIQIDEKLPPADSCMSCGNFQPPGLGECDRCASKALVDRPRRIHGWVGIQRYLHKTEFGIDLIRNGRKILRYDKRLFSWLNPDEGVAEVEYPVELGLGRIVGQIHLDHVPVNYQKNAFDWNDRQWLSASTILRGKGPMLPKRAKQLNYGDNDSPLGRLHRGYRRADPGRRYLMPGDGVQATNLQAQEWALRFHKGDPEYQSDQKWWEAVEFHENAQKGAAPPSPTPNAGSVIDELGLGPAPTPAKTGATPTVPTGSPAAAPAKPETEKEKADRLRAKGKPLPALSKEFVLEEMGSLDVTAVDVGGQKLSEASGKSTPVWLFREGAKKATAFIDTQHDIFSQFPVSSSLLLTIEVAHSLRERAGSNALPGELVSRLMSHSFSDLRIDPSSLSGSAKGLLDTVRAMMVKSIATNPARAWQHLSPEERVITETTLVVSNASMSLAQAQETGDFMLFVPSTFLARIVDEWPEAFLDGKVFRSGYAALQTMPKQVALGRVVSYLYDVAILTEANKQSPTALSRAALSLQLLRNEVVQGTDA